MAQKPTVFISYRRASSRELARYVHARLTSQGFKVFIDVEELDGKRFASAIRQKIMESDYFLIILKPDTLDENSWVRRELEAALEDAKPIIPLTADGFEFSKHVPPELAGLKDYSGIPYYDHFAEEAIERIVKIFEPPVERRSSPSPQARLRAALAIVVLLLVFGLPALSAGNTSTDIPTPTFTDTLAPSATLSVEPTATPTATDTPQPTRMLAFPCSAEVDPFSLSTTLRVVRELPNQRADIVASVRRGEMVTIIERSGGTDFYYHIQSGGRTIGWIAESYLVLSDLCPR